MAPRSPGTEAFVLIYNIDGSEAGACGNGTRCVAWALHAENGRDRFTVQTRADLLACERLRGLALFRRHGRAALRLARDSAGARGGGHE